jgi:hypothetical protein
MAEERPSDRVKKIVKEMDERYSDLKLQRSPYEDTWKDIAEFIRPSRDDFNISTTTRRHDVRNSARIHNGTPIWALNKFADGMMGYLVSPRQPWFKLGVESLTQDIPPQAREWLQLIEEIFYALLARSNFYEQVHTSFKDGGAFGPGIIYMEPSQRDLMINFATQHIKGIYMDVDKWGKVDYLIRRFPLENRAALKEFPDAFTPKEMREMEKQPMARQIYLHEIGPREDRDNTKADAENKPFFSHYKLESGDKLLRESGFGEFPYITWRMEAEIDDAYGRGAGWNALADTKRLNSMSRDITDLSQIIAHPPIEYPEERIGDISLEPSGMMPYTDPTRRIFPTQLGQNYPVARDREEGMEAAIREYLHADFFVLLEAQTRSGKRTATEVIEMQAEKAVALGAITSRVISEKLEPLFDKMFYFANESGWLPPPPPELIRMGGNVRIDYIGPLAQTQRRHYQTHTINRTLSQFIPLLEIWPEMRDLVDDNELGRFILNAGGMSEKIIRDEPEVNRIKQQRAQQQAAMMQQQAMLTAAEVNNKGGKAPEPGSMADQANQAAEEIA